MERKLIIIIFILNLEYFLLTSCYTLKNKEENFYLIFLN